jgi:hypothetical protein
MAKGNMAAPYDESAMAPKVFPLCSVSSEITLKPRYSSVLDPITLLTLLHSHDSNFNLELCSQSQDANLKVLSNLVK